jgi:hypothetical protein
MAHDLDHLPRIVGCRSIGELITLDAVEIIGGPNGLTALLATDPDKDEKRRELISSIRGGKHVELAASAVTFRQRDGSPNANFLRHKPSRLGALAESFKKMPLLVDHAKWAQRSRIGTITKSELADLPHEWSGFRQQLHVVKPDAVISVLDGTLDRFSIGWRPTGPVLCTVHKTDIRSRNSCRCWPGDRVELDGKEQITEYEYQSAEGVETSAVNVPAVSGTKIEDVRAALAAELNLQLEGPRTMQFTRLAAILGLVALSTEADEDRAIRAVEDIKRGKLAAEQERDTARTELKSAIEKTAQLAASTIKVTVDAMLEDAYRNGKLLYSREGETGKALPSPREARLRKIAERDGVDALRAELAEMPQIAPVNKKVLGDNLPEPIKFDGSLSSSVLESTARQLGLEPKDLEATAAAMYGTKEG